MGFIEDYIEYHGLLTDAPDIFAKMEAIFMIGAAVGNKFKNSLNVETYHNFFMFFVAPTSRMRKSTSLKLMNRLLRDIDMPELPGEVTPESLVKSLQERPHSVYIKDEFGSELAKMSRKNSYMSNFMDVMCKLWEEYNKYTRNTIGEGDVTVNNPYLSAMLATTDDRFEQYARNDFVMSGFLPRIMMLFPDDQDRKPYKPLYYPSRDGHLSTRLDELKSKLASYLMELFTNNDVIHMEFINVDDLNTVLQQLDSTGANSTLSALLNKMGNYIIKLADVFKLSDMTIDQIFANDTILVESEYIEKAYAIIRSMIKKYSVVFESRIEWNNPELATRRTLEYVRQQCVAMGDLKLSRWDIQTACKANARVFDEVLETLVQTGNLTEIVLGVPQTIVNPDGSRVEQIGRKGVFILREYLERIQDNYHVIDIVGESRDVIRETNGISYQSSTEGEWMDR